MEKNDIICAVTEGLGSNGEGIIRHEGVTFFVPACLPGEKEGTGNRAYLPGYRVGGKTATSEKLPRSENRYIASFLGFAPSDNPQVMALVLIDEPQGIYYGGTIAAPVIAELFENILPYLDVAVQYTENEVKELGVGKFEVPDFVGMSAEEAKKAVKAYYFDEVQYLGDGDTITEQFPKAGEQVNRNSILILYSE